MKDAKGHGSNSRGGAAHQTGIMHALVDKSRAFGNLTARFGKDTSGAGHPPKWVEHAVTEAAKEPSTYIHVAQHFAGG